MALATGCRVVSPLSAATVLPAVRVPAVHSRGLAVSTSPSPSAAKVDPSLRGMLTVDQLRTMVASTLAHVRVYMFAHGIPTCFLMLWLI